MSGSKIKSTGGSTKYYELPPEAKELDDLIVIKEMPWHIANIFKACYRYGQKEQSDKLYDINKIIFFAERQKKLLTKD